MITPKVYPPEIDVKGKDPRIGVFICHCGTNIAGVVDVEAVVEYAKTLKNVVHAERNLYTCSTDTQERIKQMIKEHDLNRVVVASCTPRTHEPLFQNTIREAGLNPYLFEMANIRDQCSWVHMHEKDPATQKAKDLVRMAVAKARLLEPLYRRMLKISRAALVIGGGLSGMSAARELAQQGFEVHLVEKEPHLGGNLSRLHFLLGGEESPQKRLQELVKEVSSSPMIRLYLGAQITQIEGSLGRFKTTVVLDERETHEIQHGVVIVATGAEEYKPQEYLYGKDERVLTQLELEERIARGGFDAKNVVMIQCIGSRTPERPYCSRICCAHAIKSAIKIKEISPQCSVHILYRDVRSYGFREIYYRKARELGVIFLRYNDDEKPTLSSQNGILTVSLKDPILGRDFSLKADLVVLSTATVPPAGNEDLAKKLKVPLTQEKFFLEAHMKLRPVDFATDGVFVCGMAHWPKSVDESISQAQAAASRAATIISKEEIELEASISRVIDENCDGCAYCIDPCPFKAITLLEYMRDGAIKKTVEVDPTACKGCGTCQATCPKKGIVVDHFRLDQIMAMVHAALER
jgi:heterodisulfide reductase subunit A